MTTKQIIFMVVFFAVGFSAPHWLRAMGVPL